MGAAMAARINANIENKIATRCINAIARGKERWERMKGWPAAKKKMNGQGRTPDLF
jgi:hypothetical protein